MRGTKEFYDLQEQFEKEVRDLVYGHKIERTPKAASVPASIFYNDGYINMLFQIYMRGYQLGKCVWRET